MKHYLAQNTIPKEDIDELILWLRNYPPLTMAAGNVTEAFEAKWCDKIGVKYSVFCNSGSSANLLAYAALLNLHPWLRVKPTFLSSAGWSTTISPLFQLGMLPILCEVDKDTFGMDLNHLETVLKANSENKCLVVLVHTLGVPNYMSDILVLQDKYHFLLMEDACPAVGSTYRKQYVGTFGDVGTFSFYYGHQISTIEGGMICTNREDVYIELLKLRSHGWSKNLWEEQRLRLEQSWGVSDHQRDFTFYSTGFNLRPTEINSFLGKLQIDRLDSIVSGRDVRFKTYKEQLKSKFIVQTPPSGSVISCITFPCIAESVEERIRLYNLLKEMGVETRPISGGNLGQQPIYKQLRGEYVKFPFAQKLHENGFVLPCHPEITLSDIYFICERLLA